MQHSRGYPKGKQHADDHNLQNVHVSSLVIDFLQCCAAPGGAAALIIAVMDPMQSFGPEVTASTVLAELPG